MKSIVIAAIALTALCFGPAQADTKVYLCKSATGGKTYSQIPCPNEQVTLSEKKISSGPMNSLPPAVAGKTRAAFTDEFQGVKPPGPGYTAPPEAVTAGKS